MRLRFVGTAGATVTPRPGCQCRVCREARAKGTPYSRLSPALFVEGPDVLFDTGEEVSVGLNRDGIECVKHLIYSHWHPDHTQGMRVLEQLNVDWLRMGESKATHTTTVYLPPGVRRDFEQRGLMASLRWYAERLGVARIVKVANQEPFEVGGVMVEAFPMRDPLLPAHPSALGLYAYRLTEGDTQVLLVLDDTKGWRPPPELAGADLLVIECGWFETTLEGKPTVPADHPLYRLESTFGETLALIEQLQPKRTIMTHIEEIYGRSLDDYNILERELVECRATFAYDGASVVI